MTDTCRDAATPAEIERARIYCVNWGAPLTSADMVAAAIAEQRAADAAEIARLREIAAPDCDLIDQYRAEIARLRMAHERKDAALRPFAEVAKVMDFYVPEANPGRLIFPLQGTALDPDGPPRVELTEADFRCALTARTAGKQGAS